MSTFLKSLVRSEVKSCAGKIRFPREDSAVRSADDMTRKKNKPNEIFEHYECMFCGGWHIGHRTNFDWIPKSHTNHHLMINQYQCIARLEDSSVCDNIWLTNTVFSSRILEHFPNVKNESEQLVRCPKCKGSWFHSLGRRWVSLEKIDPESTETLEELWKKIDTSVLDKIVPLWLD